MGREISVSHFKYHDFRRFDRLIDREMELLHDWFEQRRFSSRRAIAGLELETWIVGERGEPLPRNQELLARLNAPDVVPELSRFNVEFNVEPQPLAGRGIERLASELERTWRASDKAGAEMGASVIAIGTLPTLQDRLLTLVNMSTSLRYRALNEQVMRLRQGRPVRLEIEGRERLETEHGDVMLEGASTSFQLHLQIPLDESVRFYNASIIISAPLVALAANSPLLFGKLLWEETRVLLCEQALDVGEGRFSRVSFGSGYAEQSLEEYFVENREQYPVMLPLAMEEPSEQLAHIRLHNGTIWRWNRALIGFDGPELPHLRIEQRVPAAGPTMIDMTADMAFFFGLIEALATSDEAPEVRVPFPVARTNFYRAARFGLEAELQWLDSNPVSVRELILRDLLPLARSGLEQLEVDSDLIDRLLAVVESRVSGGQNGAVWQRRFIERHGRDMPLLVREYRDRQRAGNPVHTWDV